MFISQSDRDKILDLHRTFSVNHVVFMMDYRYDAGVVNQVLRERIKWLEEHQQ